MYRRSVVFYASWWHYDQARSKMPICVCCNKCQRENNISNIYCRFINAESSRRPLRITRPMLHRILTYHQVMPGYLDFLSVFGTQNEARDLRFSGFRDQTFLKQTTSPRPLEIESLKRSGRRYQLSYNLKAVASKSLAGTEVSNQQWYIPQAAFHHQFDVVHGTALWIVTQGHSSIKERIEDMVSIRGRPEDRAFANREGCFRTTLTTNLLYCHWSTEEWRWYIQWLEEVMEKEVSILLLDLDFYSRSC
jgi:hypothetical protein